MEIVTVATEKNKKFLHEKTNVFDFNAHTRKEVESLIKKMKKIMIDANGVGLAANQIGLPYHIFVARVPDKNGKMKFYAIFNPVLEKLSNETADLSEGCLSVPGVYGEVERHLKLTLKGFDKLGKPLKIKAWGLLAHVFQHEMDHLNGTLFIDKAKRTYDIAEHEKTKS